MIGDDFSKVAEATTEVAKTAGKAIDAGRDLGGFFRQVFGDGFVDFVGWRWADRQKVLRIRRAIYDWEKLERLRDKVVKRMHEDGIVRFRIVPPKIAIPLLEHATMEDDESLHTLWSNMLASALNAEKSPVEKIYISTLAEMSADDVLIFSEIFAEFSKLEVDSYEARGLIYELGVEARRRGNYTSVHTLTRLGLVRPAYTTFNPVVPNDHDFSLRDSPGISGQFSDPIKTQSDAGVVAVTMFGNAFMSAINADKDNDTRGVEGNT